MKARFLTAAAAVLATCASAWSASPVSRHGRLSVRDGKLVGEFTGTNVHLAGMTLANPQAQDESLVWSPSVMGWLATDWGCSLLRVGVDVSGLSALEAYRNNPNLAKGQIHQLIQGAIERGVYVVVFWHEDSLSDHPTEAKAFFEEMAMAYGDRPNLLFEPYDGLSTVSYDWSRLRKLHEEILAVVRPFSPNVVIASTPRNSRESDAVVGSPLSDSNVLYSLKLDPQSDEAKDRQRLGKMRDAKLPVFVNHLAVATVKDNRADLPLASRWKGSLDSLEVPWCGWSISRSGGALDALVASASLEGGWSASDLTETGSFFRNSLRNDLQSDARFDPIELPGAWEAREFHAVGFDHDLRSISASQVGLGLFPGAWATYQLRTLEGLKARLKFQAWAGSAGTLTCKRGNSILSRIAVPKSSGAAQGWFQTSDSLAFAVGEQELRLEWSSLDTGRIVLGQIQTDPAPSLGKRQTSTDRWRITSHPQGLEVHGITPGVQTWIRVTDLQGSLLATWQGALTVVRIPLEQRGMLVVQIREGQTDLSMTVLR